MVFRNTIISSSKYVLQIQVIFVIPLDYCACLFEVVEAFIFSFIDILEEYLRLLQLANVLVTNIKLP